jgi:hypothetical protein
MTLKMCMDGTTLLKDAVTNTALTMAGGVGGAWTEESNWRTLLGARAPVIAGATDNLLADENASFEGGTVGNWAVETGGATIAIDATQAWHGSKSIKTTFTNTDQVRVSLNATALTLASTQYTLSARIKATAGIDVRFDFYDSGGGHQRGTNVTATGEWQTITATKTYGVGLVRNISVEFWNTLHAAGNVCYIDAIQLEAGAVATPFCLNSRTACTMTIPTATIGMGVGPTSFSFAVNEPWAGNDGVLHVLLDCGAYKVMKDAANNLVFEITDGAAGVKSMGIAVTAVNMAANTAHIIQCGHDGAGVPWVNLNGTAGAVAAGAGTGIPAASGATLYVATDDTGANPWNGAALAAARNRTLSATEITALSAMTSWNTMLNQIGGDPNNLAKAAFITGHRISGYRIGPTNVGI